MSFIQPNGESRRAMADDCCHDHELKPPQFHIVLGGAGGSNGYLH